MGGEPYIPTDVREEKRGGKGKTLGFSQLQSYMLRFIATRS